jgi:hypothetical protein
VTGREAEGRRTISASCGGRSQQNLADSLTAEIDLPAAVVGGCSHATQIGMGSLHFAAARGPQHERLAPWSAPSTRQVRPAEESGPATQGPLSHWRCRARQRCRRAVLPVWPPDDASPARSGARRPRSARAAPAASTHRDPVTCRAAPTASAARSDRVLARDRELPRAVLLVRSSPPPTFRERTKRGGLCSLLTVPGELSRGPELLSFAK